MSQDIEMLIGPTGLRLFKLTTIIAETPGIGFEALRDALESETERTWGASTLYKDIRYLKELGLLADGSHRSGYYLRGATFSDEELRALLNALRVTAVNLRSPVARRLNEQLFGRLKRSRDGADVLAYPVEAVGNRVIMETLDEDFAELMESLRRAIREGREVVIRQVRDPWRRGQPTEYTIIPLQFLFHDVAWYLLAELPSAGWFKLFRMDRLDPFIEELPSRGRGIRAQHERLILAKAILRHGWGTRLPAPPFSVEHAERYCETVEVWFDQDAARFIRENERRHITQEIETLPDGSALFRVSLPPSVQEEFGFWVLSWGHHAVVRKPESLRRQLQGSLQAAVDRYAKD